MQRMLIKAGIVAALVAPGLAFAAYNDVSLTTDTVLSVNGITLNVSGSSATIESITVNDTTFSVTLPVGSSFEVTAPNLNQLLGNTSSGLRTDICNTSQSKLGYEPTSSSVTITITPTATLCSSSGSGGSGGSSSSSSSPSTTTTTTTTPVTTPATTPVTLSTPATPAAAPSGLSTSQVKAILDVLVSFNVDAATLATVKAVLEGKSAGSVTSAAVTVFKANLTVGSLGSEVKALQQFLNSKGYTIAASGAGSPGNETTKFGSLTKAALIKYQKAKGITPASGYFGPLTRAAVNAD